MNNYCITINTKKDNIVLKISEEAEQKEIINSLKEKLQELKKLYQDDKTPILVTGKILKNREIDEIKELIQKSIDVEVKFDSPTTLGLHGITKTYNKEISISETKYHKGALRSGQRVEYEGSLVIIGDVNDGAEIIAGDNIIVIGTIRGLAHAGAKGNKHACIAALSIESPQIRIANVIKEMSREEISSNENKRYAYIGSENDIIVE